MSSEIDLVATFIAAHPADAATVLERFDAKQAGGFLSQLPAAAAAKTIGYMESNAAAACIEAMTAAETVPIFAELSVRSAAALLRRLGAEAQQEILSSLESRKAKGIQQLLRSAEGTAGAIADPLVLALPANLLVADVRRQMTRSAEGLLYSIYVVDRSHRLIGVLDVRELFLAPPKQTLEATMQPQVTAVEDWMSLQGLAVHPGWQTYDILPVVDRGGVFIGAIRYRTLRRLLAESLPDRARTAAVLTTLFNLGELYWVSLAALLPGAAAHRGSSPGYSPRGGNDG